MTLLEAFERIKQARPGLTFSIDLDVWHHHHDGTPASETVEWSIYNAEERKHYRAASLEGAVMLFLQPIASLADTSAAVGEVAGAAQ